MSFNLYNIFGNISTSTTDSAKSIVCFAMFARQKQTDLFNSASWWGISALKNGAAPASTTFYANSAECLHISDNAPADTLLSVVSGS